LQKYPLQQIETADRSRHARSNLAHLLHHRALHSRRVSAMHSARQQRGELNFDPINRVHVPIALGSMILALVLLARATISGCFDETGRLAATVTVAILANAFVCGVLSGPHDRYGARIVWIATFTAAIAILHANQQSAAERKRQRRLVQARAFAPARRDRTTRGCASPAPT